MDCLPTDVSNIIYKFKRDMELLEGSPQPQHFISTFLEEERRIITMICALSFGQISTILRAREIIEASVDLIEFYRASEVNWNERHAVWGITPYETPPVCSNHIGYLVYQWLCLQEENVSLDGIAASCLLGKFCFW